VVRRTSDAETDAALRGLQDTPAAPPPPETPTAESSIFSDVDDDEIGAAFDSALGERPEPAPSDPDDSTRVMDSEAVARLAALAEGNVPPESDAPPRALDWYVAIDEKQTGPLTPEAITEHWDRGEIGPDSLTWRQGFEDWVPLSDVAELAAWLAPRPARPVFSPPSGTPAAPASVVSVPVESAFSAGGVTRTVRSEVPTPVPDSSGWRPSASAALASLVKDEIAALNKPDVPPPAPEPSPAPRGLLEVPNASTEMPAPVNGRPARSEASTSVTAVERPSFAPSYGYSTRPHKPASRKGLFIGVSAAVVVVAGMATAMVLLFERQEKAAAVATRPQLPPEPVKVTPPEPVKQTPPPAVATTTPPQQTVTPSVATPPGVTHVTPAVPPGESGGGRRTGKGTKGKGHSGGGDEVASAQDPAPTRQSGGSKSKADDLFDEVFGTGGGEKRSDEGGKGKRTAYVPPAPGSSNTEVPDRLPKGDIMSVVLANKPSIVRCVNEQKARDPNLHGTLVMHWIIQTSGKTGAVTPVTDQFKSSYMSTCLSGLVKSWSFPKHKYQPGEPVDFPFTF
jgi:hypothetical protein